MHAVMQISGPTKRPTETQGESQPTPTVALGHFYGCPHQYYLTDENTTIALDPIERSGDTVVLNPARMPVGAPVAFEFLGVSVIAIKRASGTVDFYHLD